jgi:hypothetical protein
MKTVPWQKYQNPLQEGDPYEPELQNSEYAGHQVGPKDSGSQNFSSLGLMVGGAQISVNGGGDGGGAWQTEKFLLLFSRFMTFYR